MKPFHAILLVARNRKPVLALVYLSVYVYPVLLSLKSPLSELKVYQWNQLKPRDGVGCAGQMLEDRNYTDLILSHNIAEC